MHDGNERTSKKTNKRSMTTRFGSTEHRGKNIKEWERERENKLLMKRLKIKKSAYDHKDLLKDRKKV